MEGDSYGPRDTDSSETQLRSFLESAQSAANPLQIGFDLFPVPEKG